MPQVSLYNEQGDRVGDVALSDTIFGVKLNAGVVHEAVVAARANARHPIAHTKTRGNVRGGGKKPWKQKGTGRARQGSIRAPQWVGGGIVFGPTRERNFSVKINKKTKRKALFMVLSDKVADQKFLVLDRVTTDPAKTKIMASLMKKLPVQESVLLVSPGSNPSLVRMVRNLPSLHAVNVQSLNLLDVLSARTVVFLKDAVPLFETLYHVS